ncbi:hypothetical protein JCM11491_001268 [Sporobolomyces phaffii]
MGNMKQRIGNRQKEAALIKSLREESEILTAQAEAREQRERQARPDDDSDGALEAKQGKSQERPLLRWSAGTLPEAFTFGSTGLSESYKLLKLDPRSTDEVLLPQLLALYHETAVPYVADLASKRTMGAILIVACSRVETRGGDDGFYKLSQWLYLAEANQQLARTLLPLPSIDDFKFAKLEYSPGTFAVHGEPQFDSTTRPSAPVGSERSRGVTTVASVIEAEFARMRREIKKLKRELKEVKREAATAKEAREGARQSMDKPAKESDDAGRLGENGVTGLDTENERTAQENARSKKDPETLSSADRIKTSKSDQLKDREERPAVKENHHLLQLRRNYARRLKKLNLNRARQRLELNEAKQKLGVMMAAADRGTPLDRQLVKGAAKSDVELGTGDEKERAHDGAVENSSDSSASHDSATQVWIPKTARLMVRGRRTEHPTLGPRQVSLPLPAPSPLGPSQRTMPLDDSYDSDARWRTSAPAVKTRPSYERFGAEDEPVSSHTSDRSHEWLPPHRRSTSWQSHLETSQGTQSSGHSSPLHSFSCPSSPSPSSLSRASSTSSRRPLPIPPTNQPRFVPCRPPPPPPSSVVTSSAPSREPAYEEKRELARLRGLDDLLEREGESEEDDRASPTLSGQLLPFYPAPGPGADGPQTFYSPASARALAPSVHSSIPPPPPPPNFGSLAPPPHLYQPFPSRSTAMQSPASPVSSLRQQGSPELSLSSGQPKPRRANRMSTIKNLLGRKGGKGSTEGEGRVGHD